MTAEPNPYETLCLRPGASGEEVVRQASQLRQRLTNEDAVTQVRRAVQALTGDERQCRIHEVLAFPDPCYQWKALEAFVSAHRRPPGSQARTDDVPGLDLSEFAALLHPLLAQELDPGPLILERVDQGEEASEIRAQTVEGLWQALPWDPRA